MQFKYPELLWALLLLLIPIIIHLFQLRRYKRTAFTNVSLLQKVVSQTRKSQLLKKWLLLVSRLLLFGFVILAFAQPYLADERKFRESEKTIYLDDSFSMQARTENGELLELAVQDLLKGLNPDEQLNLFTNVETFSNVAPAAIQNELIGLSHTYNQLGLNEIVLKAGSLFSSDNASEKLLLVVSDFQERMYQAIDSLKDMEVHMVKLQPEPITNISLDSIFISNQTPTQLELKATLTSTGIVETTPVSMWNADTLIAKTAARFTEGGNAQVVFSLPKDIVIDGKVGINDAGLNYDNQIYFNINKKEKIRVMAIGPEPASFLQRIFNEDEFDLEQYQLSDLNYSSIDRQNMVILNELSSVPTALQNALQAFTASGGSLVIIPAEQADLNTYNQLLINLTNSRFTGQMEAEHQITNISFEHPVFNDVFEKSVTNFQYPTVNSYFGIQSADPIILGYENGDPFLVGEQGIFVFTSPIGPPHSNFINSPLIVPTLYNMGALSLKLPALYHLLSSSTKIDIPVSLSQDEIAKVIKDNYEFIPLQQSFSNKTSLDFEAYPEQDGIFDIVLNDSLISRISFNYPRGESQLTYADISALTEATNRNNISDFLISIEKRNSVKQLWLPFVILALLFVIAEVLIQKFIK